MTRIKLCGLTRPEDIRAANELGPDCVGFVFAPRSRRYVTPQRAAELKQALDPRIRAVGVFVNETAQAVAAFLNGGIIDIAQLHGSEDEEYIQRLRALTGRPLIRAFRIETERDIARAGRSGADYILLDAGGLNPDNVKDALRRLAPYGVDVSSGIETDGIKDKRKMAAFVAAVRKEDEHDQS